MKSNSRVNSSSSLWLESHNKDPGDEGLCYFKEVVRSGPLNFIFHRTWTIAFYVSLSLRLVWKVYKWILWGYSAHSLESLRPLIRVSYCISRTDESVFKNFLSLDRIAHLSSQWPYQTIGKLALINPNWFHFHFSFVVWIFFLKTWYCLFCPITNKFLNVEKVI